MKIAVWHNLPSGGGKRALHQHVAGLTALGHEVQSWTLEGSDPTYLPLAEFGAEHVVPFVDHDASPGARVRTLLGESNTHRRIARLHAACGRCGREMEAWGADVVFAASCRVLGVPAIGLHTRLPTVGYVQEPYRAHYEAGHMGGNVLPWVIESPGRGGRLRGAVARDVMAFRAREEWRAVHALDRLLVNSRFSRESFLRAYAADGRVCYLGVDTRLFADAGDRAREPFLVGLGSFHAIKGIELAVRALALVPAPRPALVWVGNSADDGYLDRMARLAESLGVEFRPRRRIPDAEVVDLLGRAAALLYTSRLEPFGYAPIEANACGTPVVAVAEGGVRETVVDGVNGVLADDRDPAGVAEAIVRLLADPEAARGMGRRGRELVYARWTAEQSSARAERHLREVAADGRHAAPPAMRV